MTTVYFIRHAKPDFSVLDEAIRPLTEQGKQDSLALVPFFADKKIDAIYSSPYLRSKETVMPIAKALSLPVHEIHNLRERKVCDEWIEDFNGFAKKQWEDFDYRLENGESLNEVKLRNVAALESILEKHPNETIIIGTHGTSLSTIFHHYNSTYDYTEFQRMKDIMPWVVVMEFEGKERRSLKEVQEMKA